MLTTRILLSLAFCGLTSGILRADGLSSTGCPAATLVYYNTSFMNPDPTAVDGPCSIGILNYSQFDFESIGAGATLGPGAFELTPISPGLASEGNTGFTMSSSSPKTQISVAPGQSATYVIDWFFAIDNGPIAGGASLGMDPPEGNVTISTEYCVDSFLTLLDNFSPTTPDTCSGNGGAHVPLQSLSVTTTDPHASIVFSTPAYQFADVRTLITLTGDKGEAGFDGVSSESSISQTPEPRTFLLVFGLLLFLVFMSKRTVAQ